MKNKIYSKLFQFVDPKSWKKEDRDITSSFYLEYKLSFRSEGMFWKYHIAPGYETYSGVPSYGNVIHNGIVTLNVGGKILFSSIFFLFLYIIFLLCDCQNCIKEPLLNIGAILLSFFISNILFPIFNWKLYISFRTARYYIKNMTLIASLQEQDELNEKIVSIINNKAAENPKLARKTKLKKLNDKKLFPWSK
jgi:hypothetical protein